MRGRHTSLGHPSNHLAVARITAALLLGITSISNRMSADLSRVGMIDQACPDTRAAAPAPLSAKT